MFHVKPKTMKIFFKRIIIVFEISLCFVASLASQESGRFSIGTSLDYGAGKDFNNYATTLHINYNLIERIRISPSFSYFLNKDNMKMSAIALNCHYLFPKLAESIFPVLKNQGICFYPIAGFYISNFRNDKKPCYSCVANENKIGSKLRSNFGFDFGVGIEQEIPTLLPILKDMSLNFEYKYQALDNYRRPLISFGLLYDF